MGLQIEQGSRVADNEKVLKDIRGVSDVVEANTQEYMLFEVNQAEQEYNDNKHRFTQLVILLPDPAALCLGFFICGCLGHLRQHLHPNQKAA